MTIQDIIEALDTKVHGLKQKRDMLQDEFAYADNVPEGFDNWLQVEGTIDNYTAQIADFEAAIWNLHKWNNRAF